MSIAFTTEKKPHTIGIIMFRFAFITLNSHRVDYYTTYTHAQLRNLDVYIYSRLVHHTFMLSNRVLFRLGRC